MDGADAARVSWAAGRRNGGSSERASEEDAPYPPRPPRMDASRHPSSSGSAGPHWPDVGVPAPQRIGGRAAELAPLARGVAGVPPMRARSQPGTADALQAQVIVEGVKFATWVLREGRVARPSGRWDFVERLLIALAGDGGVRSAEQLVASILRSEGIMRIKVPAG